MQSQSCQFSLHIDFSKISPAALAFRGTEGVLIEHRSQEHSHSWVRQGTRAESALGRKLKEQRKGRELGSPIPLDSSSINPDSNTQNSAVSLMASAVNLRIKDINSSPTCARPGINSAPEKTLISWPGTLSAVLRHSLQKQHVQEQHTKLKGINALFLFSLHCSICSRLQTKCNSQHGTSSCVLRLHVASLPHATPHINSIYLK